jgi:hypothetical protein
VKARAISIDGLLTAAPIEAKRTNSSYCEVNMATAAETDIREIKTAIEANTKAIESIARLTEANAKAIADLTLDMRVGFASVDTKFAVLREETQIGFASVDTKFASIDTKFAVLREEMQVGFANIDTKFAKLEGKIDTVEAKLEGKIDKLEERTNLGFWGFIFRGTALAALAALTAIFVKYLFPMLPPELPKL